MVITNNNSIVKNPTLIEYKQSGKFLNIRMKACGVKIIRMQKFIHPLIEFQNPFNPKEKILITGWDKIGMLSDYLGMKRNRMKELVESNKPESLKVINDILQEQQERIIKIDASLFNKQFFAFNIATNEHTTITFSEIRSVVERILGTEINEITFNRSLVWEKHYKTVTFSNEAMDVIIRVTSGRNIKTSAIKVMVYIRIKTCKNSLICANYTAIKHMENWNARLVQTLSSAMEITEVAITSIQKFMNVPLSYDEGIKYIENIPMFIMNPAKITKIKEVLKKRFAFEYEKQQNRFALSQTLSFVGSHSLPEESSERTLEILQEQAFAVFSNQLTIPNI